MNNAGISQKNCFSNTHYTLNTFQINQGNAVIVSRSAARAREAANANYEKQEELEEEINNATFNANVEQNRYVNFWIGVQKSMQIKHHAKKSMDPKMRNRFKQLDVRFGFICWLI